jgi:hypothetical protein
MKTRRFLSSLPLQRRAGVLEIAGCVLPGMLGPWFPICRGRQSEGEVE